jgi:hypothetical protein
MLSGWGMSLDDVFPRELIGITEAERKLKIAAADMAPPGKKRQVIEATMRDFAHLAVSRPNGYSLVSVDDKRDAVNPFALAFGNIVIPPMEPLGEAT